jgi:hypothetical protein
VTFGPTSLSSANSPGPNFIKLFMAVIYECP